MDYSKLSEIYLNRDVELLKRYIDTYEYKILPLLGANGDVDDINEELFIDICSWMFKNGLDINVVEEYGNSGLIISVLKNKENYVKMYLDNGANVNIKGQYGATPLMVALNSNASEKIIYELIKAGADLNASFVYDGRKMSIIEQACVYGSIELLEYILEHGALIERQIESINNIEWDDTETDKKMRIMLKEYAELQKKSDFKPKKIELYNESIEKEEGLINMDDEEILKIVRDSYEKITKETREFRILLNEKLEPVRINEENYDLDGVTEVIISATEELGDNIVNCIELVDKVARDYFRESNDFQKIKEVYTYILKDIKGFESVKVEWGFNKYYPDYVYEIPFEIEEIEKYWKELIESMPEYDEDKIPNGLEEIILSCLSNFDEMVTITEMRKYEYSLNNYALSTIYNELNKLCEVGKVTKQIINEKSYFKLIK